MVSASADSLQHLIDEYLIRDDLHGRDPNQISYFLHRDQTEVDKSLYGRRSVLTCDGHHMLWAERIGAQLAGER